MDVIAVTTIYEWVVAPIGLAVAAVIGGGGLTLAGRWDSQQLGLLVLVPLIALAPVVTDGITLLLVGFMLALSAASVMVQLGKDWIWLQPHASRPPRSRSSWRWPRCTSMAGTICGWPVRAAFRPCSPSRQR